MPAITFNRYQNTAPWQAAAQALLVSLNQNGPKMCARIGMMLALYPRGERVFNPDRKDHLKVFAFADAAETWFEEGQQLRAGKLG